MELCNRNRGITKNTVNFVFKPFTGWGGAAKAAKKFQNLTPEQDFGPVF